MDSGVPKDPHWDQVVEIASKLWVDGNYVTELDSSQSQRYVDLLWAAHHAGRLLGGRAKIETSCPREREDPTVTITVRFLDNGGTGLLRAEEGLEKLLRQVLAQDPPT